MLLQEILPINGFYIKKFQTIHDDNGMLSQVLTPASPKRQQFVHRASNGGTTDWLVRKSHTEEKRQRKKTSNKVIFLFANFFNPDHLFVQLPAQNRRPVSPAATSSVPHSKKKNADAHSGEVQPRLCPWYEEIAKAGFEINRVHCACS